MLLLLSVLVVSVLIGLIAGGRLGRLFEVKLSWWPLLPVALALQFVPVPDGSSGRWVALGALLASYALLVSVAVCNIRRAGFPLILAGLLLNALVIGLNGGMPVSYEAVFASGQPEVAEELKAGDLSGFKHKLAEEGGVLLPFLSDVIPVGTPFHLVVSAGDIVFYAGIAWFVVGAMRSPSGPRRRAAGGSPGASRPEPERDSAEETQAGVPEAQGPPPEGQNRSAGASSPGS